MLESMKMETKILAQQDGEVEEVFVVDNDQVEADALLLRMKDTTKTE